MPESGPSALRWRRSSYSHNNSQQQCVEVAEAAHVVCVRDSKDPAGPRLTLGRDAFRGLVERVKAGGLE
ncbi:DUF397 domain-containing protein [Actinomadura luteofluorescens]|uniref:DUF397 domain-containing protein n=1 Tax=Actinomadura luteofluorescens TaxID=46163 RepID=A0A7Y9JH59_9ACTN|nr:DUF397 domain-containing protein [Actinomadura luteofluorescens]NYD48685.1 hypothetical protein [Actinomadura luteofluorescens]